MTQRPFAAVIMAGGQGTRFWPLSTPERPKQFLDLERTGRNLLQATYDRLLPLAGGPHDVYVATAARYRALVREQLPDLPADQPLVETRPRDSGLVVLGIATTHPSPSFGYIQRGEAVDDVFSTLPRRCIDYAVMEHTRRAFVVPVGVHDLVVVKLGHTVLLVAEDRIGELKRVLGDERLSVSRK